MRKKKKWLQKGIFRRSEYHIHTRFSMKKYNKYCVDDDYCWWWWWCTLRCYFFDSFIFSLFIAIFHWHFRFVLFRANTFIHSHCEYYFRSIGLYATHFDKQSQRHFITGPVGNGYCYAQTKKRKSNNGNGLKKTINFKNKWTNFSDFQCHDKILAHFVIIVWLQPVLIANATLIPR